MAVVVSIEECGGMVEMEMEGRVFPTYRVRHFISMSMRGSPSSWRTVWSGDVTLYIEEGR